MFEDTIQKKMNKMPQKCKAIYQELLELLFPRRCPVCDAILPFHGPKVCIQCQEVFQFTKEPTCLICGKEVSKEEKEYCEDCRKRKHFFTKNFACFDYRSMSQSIYRFKYGKRQEYANYYAEQIVNRYHDAMNSIKPDALIPVPLYKDRYRKRGYNQAEVLAKEISKITGIPVVSDYVVRCKKTTPQKQLSRQNRQNNLKKAFKIKGNDVKLNTIIVIDDIYTTGSTIDAIAKVCLEDGVREVYSICLAIGKGIS